MSAIRAALEQAVAEERAAVVADMRAKAESVKDQRYRQALYALAAYYTEGHHRRG